MCQGRINTTLIQFLLDNVIANYSNDSLPQGVGSVEDINMKYKNKRPNRLAII